MAKSPDHENDGRNLKINHYFFSLYQDISNTSNLVPGVPRVELSQGRGRDPLQHLLGEDTEQLPADVQGLEDSAVLVVTLGT